MSDLTPMQILERAQDTSGNLKPVEVIERSAALLGVLKEGFLNFDLRPSRIRAHETWGLFAKRSIEEFSDEYSKLFPPQTVETVRLVPAKPAESFVGRWIYEPLLFLAHLAKPAHKKRTSALFKKHLNTIVLSLAPRKKFPLVLEFVLHDIMIERRLPVRVNYERQGRPEPFPYAESWAYE